MPPLEIYQLGGWALAVFMAFSITLAFIRSDLVSGIIYRREIARGDRLEAEGVRLARRYRSMERQRDRAREALRAERARRRVAG